MKNLRVLNLTAKATNEVLHAVCLHCPHLEELNVALSNIDDDGLKLLGNVSNEEGSNAVVSGCPDLTSLSIFKCWLVTPRAVARILRDMRKLRRVEYDDCVSSLRMLYSERKATGRKRTRAFFEADEASEDGSSSVGPLTSPWSLQGSLCTDVMLYKNVNLFYPTDYINESMTSPPSCFASTNS